MVQIGVARRAADRLSAKLEEANRSGQAVDMEEEFRLLTLQVIGEAVLSLPADECDRVCPQCPSSSQARSICTIRVGQNHHPCRFNFGKLISMQICSASARCIARDKHAG